MVHLDRPLDIVVYGATSFTGQIVVKYLKDHASHIKLGLGGRSEEKVKKVAEEVGLKDAEIIIADSKDASALKEMVKKTKAVITLVGPYGLYGDALIKACATSGTHYFDLTAETLWQARQIQALSEPALRTGAIIVNSCGWDSVPSDLGAMLAVRELKRVGGKATHAGRVTLGVKAKGGMSGGTIQSGIAIAEEGISKNVALAKNLYVLSPVKGAQTRGGQWVYREPGLWGGTFIMGLHNSAIVRRTWGILSTLQTSSERDGVVEAYGPAFDYKEFMCTPDPVSAFLLSLALFIVSLFLAFPPTRYLVKKFGPQSGTGPSKESQEKGWFKYYTTAYSEDGSVVVRATLTGKGGDPGYKWTAACISECALSVVENWDRLSPLAREGGPLTPATALGDVLIDRLSKNNLLDVKLDTLKGGSEGKRKKSQ